ncbi:MAG: InlB B-repeat-containing protein, partial [Bacteroidota bacterium]
MDKKLSIVCFSLVMFVVSMLSPVVFASVQKYEKELKIVSGSNRDLRTFTYNGHVVSEGFAATVTTFRPVRPNEESFSKAGIAVSLGGAWFEGEGVGATHYFPFVKEMWIKIEGDSNFRNEVHPNGIATNTGTGSNCTVSWKLVLDILKIILPSILKRLFEAPPAKEWQSDLHWLKAIVRQDQPPEDILGQWHQILQTAACDFDILFQNVVGYQYLAVTAGAEIWLERYYEGREVPTISYYHIGDYSVSFTVEVPVTNEPNDPYTPSGPNSGYSGVSYNYSTSATDPNGDSLRYEFDWGDGSTTTTGYYPSGSTVYASHTWSSPGTYNVTVRAQDIYEEWSNWSPYLTVNIVDREPNTPSTPSGPTSGYRNVWYTYSTTATDPDGNNIRYEFEFSGPIPTVSFTTGWYASGQTGSITVMWETTDPPGTYYVRARAQDVYGAWSGWSAPLNVSIRDPTLTISASWGGTTNPSPGTYSYVYGTSVSVTAIPSSGYYFAYWLLDSTTYYYSNPITVTMTADHSLTAYFYSSSGGGDGCPTLFT